MTGVQMLHQLGPSAHGSDPDPGSIAWIAVDWGTSSMRAWAMSAHDTVIAELRSAEGIGKLEPDRFELALLDTISGWLTSDQRMPVVACGMVGARQGWAEADYAYLPWTPAALHKATLPPTSDPRLRVMILPGLCQIDPAEVMRGEETQIAGYVSAHPSFSGTICLPGSHSKWVRVSDGVVHGFTTAMTGEVFAALSRNTVLRHSVTDSIWSDMDFADGVDSVMANGDSLLTRLFSIRASCLVEGVSNFDASSRLSGLLIGSELAATRNYWQDQRVVLIGEPSLAERYRKALSRVQTPAICADATRCTVAGLALAYRSFSHEVTV